MRTMQVFLALTMVAACGGAGGPALHPKDATEDSSLSSSGDMAGAGGAVVGAGGSVGTGGAAGGAPGSGGSSDAGDSDGPFQCLYQGRLYRDGESVYLSDGCNVCVCKKEYGGMACTGAICGTGGATSAGGRAGTGGTGTAGTAGAGGRTGGTLASGGVTGTSAGGGITGRGGSASGGAGTGGSHGTGGAAAAGGHPGTGGAGAASDDGGTVDVGGECGDPVAKASYAACRESNDEATCSERGGSWDIRYSTLSEYTCVCPTGQGGCPCTASSDCLGHCSAWKDPFGNGAWCQANVTSYTCTARGGQSDCMCVPYEPYAVCFTW